MHNKRPAAASLGTRLNLVFLEAHAPLTKSFARAKGSPDIIKTPYPLVWEFTSHKESWSTLPELEALLRVHATKGNCLLKGSIARDLKQESRAGATDANGQTDWIVLDFDGLPDTIPDMDSALGLMGLGDHSYVVQWSASYGINDKRIRAHVFMPLDKMHAAPLLKQWLTHLNHSVPFLRNSMTLTKTGNSISWPLDISACQNDKLIYIAPPVLKGIVDPMKGRDRIQYVRRKLEKLVITTSFNTEKNRDSTNKRIAELREADGLPKRKFTTKMHGSTEILIKPDASVITEMKQERGFVYFNLNGGDSWAYYHPESNPEFIFNFKGEPAYLTKELLPEYWSQISQEAVRTSSDGITYLAFCDRKTSAYWRGTYDAKADHLELHMAKNETQLRHFAKQYGMPLGDYIPEWDLEFNPQHTGERVDFQTHTINQFAPTVYMKAKPKKTPACPPITLKVMSHALGNDQAIVEHFINWLAFILQCRDRTKTAWIMHGVPGTGKGILMNNIIRPIFGMSHTSARRMEELNEQYNQYMKNSLIVYVDEVQTKALQNERGVMAKLKNFITEAYVTIREMYSNAAERYNYTNWIFASNMPDPVSIDKDDRRFNVGAYQPTMLQITDAEVKTIESELQAMHDFLATYKVDKEMAMTVLKTKDRETMISISESSIDTVSSALLEGNFDFLIDQLPHGDNFTTDWRYLERLTAYQAILRSLISRTNENGKCNLAREELRLVYDFIVGSMPQTPNKFTSLLKHHRIHIEKVWLDDKTVSGIRVQWRDVTGFEKHLEDLTPKVVTAQRKAAAAQAATIAKPATPTPALKPPAGSRMGRRPLH